MSWNGSNGLADEHGQEILPPYKVYRDMGNGRQPYDAFPNPRAAVAAAAEYVGRCFGTEITGNRAGKEVIWFRSDRNGAQQFYVAWRP